MRRLVTAVVTVAVALGGVVGIVAFFASRDQATTQQAAPAGTLAPGTGGGLLTAGNVELDYGRAADGPRLRALARSLGAPDTPALRAAGQAVVVRRRPGVGGVLARALHHRLEVASPADPRLQDFVESWLGGAAPG